MPYKREREIDVRGSIVLSDDDAVAVGVCMRVEITLFGCTCKSRAIFDSNENC